MGLPVSPCGVAPGEIMMQVPRDKKSRHGRVRWVLPRAIGDVVFDHEVSDGDLLACLEAQSLL
jgi:3-dehydroquinate synthetase